MQDSGLFFINTEANVKFAVVDIDKRVMQVLYRFGYCENGRAGDISENDVDCCYKLEKSMTADHDLKRR